jgi:hypothetical protein
MLVFETVFLCACVCQHVHVFGAVTLAIIRRDRESVTVVSTAQRTLFVEEALHNTNLLNFFMPLLFDVDLFCVCECALTQYAPEIWRLESEECLYVNFFEDALVWDM